MPATTEFLGVLWTQGCFATTESKKQRREKNNTAEEEKHGVFTTLHMIIIIIIFIPTLIVIFTWERNFSSPACLTACQPASLLPASLVVNKWICRMKVTSPQFEIEKVYNHCCKMKWNPELLQKLDSSQNTEQNPSLPKRSTAVSSLTAREKGVEKNDSSVLH